MEAQRYIAYNIAIIGYIKRQSNSAPNDSLLQLTFITLIVKSGEGLKVRTNH